MYPRRLFREEAKITQHHYSNKELCEIGEEGGKGTLP